MIYNCIHLY